MPVLSTRKHDALDDRFEKLLLGVQFDVVETELTEAKKRARRALADQPGAAGELAFLEIYFKNIFAAPWADVHRHIAALQAGKHTVSGHRRSGKSATTLVAKLIKPMAEGNAGMLGLALRTQDKAEARGAALVRLLTTNRLLAYDYGVEVQQSRGGHWIINNTHFITGSFKVGLRAYVDDDFKRFRTFITDDLYDRTTVTSELDNERVTEFVTSEVWGQLEDGALNVNLGNSISETCPIERLREINPANHYVFPAVDEAGASMWPERFTTEYWASFQAETPTEIWLGDYLCRPALTGEFFDADWLSFSPTPDPADVVATITTTDPSYGQSADACFKASVALSLLKSGRIHVDRLRLRRGPYAGLFDWMATLPQGLTKLKAHLFENDFSQWAFAEPYYQAWVAAGGLPLAIVRHSAKQAVAPGMSADKEARIIALVHPFQTGIITFDLALKGSKDFEQFRIQLLSFGRSREKLDGPDALATGVVMVRRYAQTGSFKPTPSGRRLLQRPKWLGGFR